MSRYPIHNEMSANLSPQGMELTISGEFHRPANTTGECNDCSGEPRNCTSTVFIVSQRRRTPTKTGFTAPGIPGIGHPAGICLTAPGTHMHTDHLPGRW